jgi:hypothetical protein
MLLETIVSCGVKLNYVAAGAVCLVRKMQWAWLLLLQQSI